MTDAIAVVPAGILAATGVVILLTSRFTQSGGLAKLLCYAALAAAAVTLESVTNSPFARAVGWVTLAFGLLLAVSADEPGRSWIAHRLAWLLLSASGVLMACAPTDYVWAVFAMSLAAFPATAVLYAEADTPAARKSANWSLAFNLLALAFLVVGAGFVAWLAGTTNLAEVQALFSGPVTSRFGRTSVAESSIRGELGCLLLLAGLGIQFLAAPFQLAAAEIFEGAKSWAVSLTVVLPRGAALVLLIRLLVNGMPRYASTTQTAMTAVAILTMSIGGVLAFSQTSIRRLLAITMAVQGALILDALAAGCSEVRHSAASPWIGAEIPGAVGSACLCFAFDSLALVGFLAILGSWNLFDRGIDAMSEIAAQVRADRLRQAALFRGDRLRPAALCVLLIGLAGLPPFAGFWARAAILRSMLSITMPPEHGFLPHQNVGYVAVALVAVVAMIALAAVYGKLILDVLFSNQSIAEERSEMADREALTGRGAGAWIGILAAATLAVSAVCPGPLSRLAARATLEQRELAIHPGQGLKKSAASSSTKDAQRPSTGSKK